MDSAQDKTTGIIVDAEDLWLLEVVDKNAYMCRGCGIKVTPASYQPHNLVRPYFTARSEDHKLDCDVEGTKELVTKAKSTRLNNSPSGFPLAYPNRLVLKEKYFVTDSEKPIPSSDHRRSQKSTDSSTKKAMRTGGHEVNTIRPICKAFINYPYDRDLKLTLPDIEANTYLTIFKKLKRNELIQFPANKIFYAAIRWEKPIQTEKYLEVILDAGGILDKHLQNNYRVRIHWNNWSTSKRRYVYNEIEVARTEAMAAKKKGLHDKGYLFFKGQQNEANIRVFDIIDHRLICCIVGEIIYPVYSSLAAR